MLHCQVCWQLVGVIAAFHKSDLLCNITFVAQKFPSGSVTYSIYCHIEISDLVLLVFHHHVTATLIFTYSKLQNFCRVRYITVGNILIS